MGCPDANLIAAFVSGTLDPARAEQLAGHLDGCAACDELVAWSMRRRVVAGSGRDRRGSRRS
jgi:anti-sigma factor RsiW